MVGQDDRFVSSAALTTLVVCGANDVEQAFRLPCRYSYRHSPKNVGADADVAT
jgi:hypothetical protein